MSPLLRSPFAAWQAHVTASILLSSRSASQWRLGMALSVAFSTLPVTATAQKLLDAGLVTVIATAIQHNVECLPVVLPSVHFLMVCHPGPPPWLIPHQRTISYKYLVYPPPTTRPMDLYLPGICHPTVLFAGIWDPGSFFGMAVLPGVRAFPPVSRSRWGGGSPVERSP